MESLNKAIKHFGSQTKLAEALGLTAMAVTQWKKRKVPLEAAKEIERVTNGEVTKYDLRPDFFDPPEQKSA